MKLMFRKLCLLMMIIAILFTVSAALKLSSYSQVQVENVDTGKWDKDRSTRLQGSNSEDDASSIIESNESFNSNNVGQQEPKRGEKIDFSQLDKLDSSSFSWWILLNKKHEPTTISSDIKKMIDENNAVYLGDTTKKDVYLTFDEGYENGYTPQILDTLKANNVKALFFVTGPYVKSYDYLVKRMLDEGHLVGNHSINHPSLPELDNTDLENELLGLEKNFMSLTGKNFKYMRPPKGEYSEKVLAAASQLGYKTVFWSFAYRDFELNNQRGADFAYKMVMDNIHNGAIILLHAVSKDNTEALDSIIKAIKAEGYNIKPFDL
jgi:peptidoglycan-N-acetylmuramic acid deacetylase